MEHEARVLWGVMEYLLPQVGPHVRTLDLAHGKAVSNEVVRERHQQCDIITYTGKRAPELMRQLETWETVCCFHVNIVSILP